MDLCTVIGFAASCLLQAVEMVGAKVAEVGSRRCQLASLRYVAMSHAVGALEIISRQMIFWLSASEIDLINYLAM